MIRFKMLLFITGAISLAKAQDNAITAGAVVDRIKNHITVAWEEETVDTFKSGSDTVRISGIATTFLANLDVLQRARAKGLNMVITHEPTYYNHFDEKERFGDDPVLRAKLKFIEANNIVIWRFHDHWHRTDPDGIFKGIVDQLQWNTYREDKNMFIIPETTLGELANRLKAELSIKTMRVIGDTHLPIKNVAMRLGAPGSMAQIELLKREDVSVLIGGESPEWETVEYVRDAIAAGMGKSLILLGHAISEEPGMAYCAEWLREFIAEVPIEFIPAKEPFWSPR